MKLCAGGIVVLATIPAGCAPDEPETPSTIVPAVSSRLRLQPATSPSRAFFVPISQGWMLDGSPRIVPVDDLEGYLGQDAPYYRLFDLLDVVTSTYVQRSTGLPATVEIFRFDNGTNAFGAFSARRPDGAEALEIGDGAWSGRNAIHVLSDRYLLRVIGGNGSISSVVPLAEGLAARIPAAGQLPEPLSIFPWEDRVADSEKYVRGPALGQSYFRSSWLVRYQMGESRIDAMLHDAGANGVAAERLARYRRFFETNGRLLDPIPKLGDESFTGEDRLIGRAVVWRAGTQLVAVQGMAPVSLLEELAREILMRQTVRSPSAASGKEPATGQTKKEEVSGT